MTDSSVRVYRYGARAPDENVQRVDQQLWLAHRYRNALVEIERGRRSLLPPRCACAAGTGRCACVVCTAPLNGTRPHCANTDAAWAFVRSSAIGAANTAAYAAGRRLRAACGIYWGSYLLVEQAIDAARSGPDAPRFLRYDGAGRIGVQLQRGLGVAAAFGGADTRLRIERLPDPPGVTPGSRRAGRRVRVHMRIGSDGRQPVWTAFDAAMHRPLPDGAVIKWAVLRRDRVGPDFRWSLQLTVEQPAPPAVTDRRGVVAVDLGWRVRPDGTRVGYWADDAGRHGEILMPGSVRDDLAHIRSIKAARDRLFNEFRDRVVGWLRDRADALLDEWLRDDAATIWQWRSADRLARLAWRWRGARFAGDKAIFDTRADCPRDANGALDCTAHVECWRRKDRHLARWYAHGLANIIGHRNETYRIEAARLAATYGAVVIERFNMRPVIGRHDLDETASDAEKVRADRASSMRHATAPGVFRLAVVNACRARGVPVVVVPAEWTTQECAACGCVKPWDAAPAVDHTCAGCGATWDQDRNAAVQILRRGLAVASGPVTPAGAGVLAGGKSARQRRFSRRRDHAEGSVSSENGGCSQIDRDVDGNTPKIARVVGSLAQEART